MNPYEILGVSPDASDEEIKAARKQYAKENHSDTGGNDDLMALGNAAYDILKDKEKRAKYDRGENPNKKDPTPEEAAVQEFTKIYSQVMSEYNFNTDYTTYIKEEMNNYCGYLIAEMDKAEKSNNKSKEKVQKQMNFIKNPEDVPGIYAISFLQNAIFDIEQKNKKINFDRETHKIVINMVEKFDIEEIVKPKKNHSSYSFAELMDEAQRRANNQ